MHVPIPFARRWPSRTRRLTTILGSSLVGGALLAGVVGTVPAAALTAQYPSIEQFYLGLVNCTRTGGWVQQDGSCKGYGSGRYSAYVPPIRLGPNLSDVSRKWSRYLAINNGCFHGDPGARMRAAGFNGWSWGENIGCGAGTSDVRASVLASHLAMQAEKSSNGGHWKNIKNPRFTLLGVGIWKYGSRVRVTSDFYGG